MANRVERVELGIFRRRHRYTGKLLKPLWISYARGSKSVFEATHTTKVVEARKLRALRLAAALTGDARTLHAARITVSELLAALVCDYKNGYASLPSVKGHVKAWCAALGPVHAMNIATERIAEVQRSWIKAKVKPATVNRRCAALRRAYTLAARSRRIPYAPFVPMLEERSPLGRYLNPADTVLLVEHLPTYLAELVHFAREYGIRRGQLARTLRAYVDLGRAVIAWPPAECKANIPHVLPLDEAGCAQVERLMADGATRLWCPYLFHGRTCSAGRTVSKKYGCVGDTRKAWMTACKNAGLPAGRKAGGYVFHHLRNTFATDFRAGGVSVEDTQAVGGWKTAHVVERYNLGNVEALRGRMAETREKVTRLRAKRATSS